MSREIGRKELYEWVWSRPSTEVAAELGISDSAVGKICKKLNVPKPPPGYWAKVEFGKQVQRSPLPPIENGSPEFTVIYAVDPADPSQTVLHIEVQNIPIVPYDPNNPPPLTTKVKNFVSAVEVTDSDLIHLPRGEGFPELMVSKTTLERALVIFGTLIVSLEAAGHSVMVSNNSWGEKTRITKEGQEVTIAMNERLRKVQRQPTGDDRKKPPYLLDTFDERVPCGELQIKVNGACGDYQRWVDRKKQLLEARLEEILTTIAQMIEFRIQLAREREAERQRLEEILRRRREEEIRRKNFQVNIDAWKSCEDARAYLRAFEARLQQLKDTGINVDEDEEWLKWAKDYVETLDPMNKIGRKTE